MGQIDLIRWLVGFFGGIIQCPLLSREQCPCPGSLAVTEQIIRRVRSLQSLHSRIAAKSILMFLNDADFPED